MGRRGNVLGRVPPPRGPLSRFCAHPKGSAHTLPGLKVISDTASVCVYTNCYYTNQEIENVDANCEKMPDLIMIGQISSWPRWLFLTQAPEELVIFRSESILCHHGHASIGQFYVEVQAALTFWDECTAGNQKSCWKSHHKAYCRS